MNLGNHPTYRRTWAQRHPVLFECLGIALATAGVCAMTYLLVVFA